MAFTVPIRLGYAFTAAAPFDEVFGLLSDVPASIAHFPDVEGLDDLGDGAWRTRMRPVGLGTASLRAVHASTYVADRRHGTVTWSPVPGEGNARVGGSWTMRRHGGHTTVELSIEAHIDVPFPALSRRMVEPLVKAAFEKLVDRYVDNVVRALGGEV